MDLNKEKYAFDLFLKLHGLLPAGDKTESPDYIVHLINKRIGVELTEFMEEEESDGISLPAKYVLEDKISNTVKTDFDISSNKRIVANIQFRDKIEIKSNRIKPLSKEISNRINNSILDSPNKIYHNLEIIDDLPDEIVNIYFDIAPFLEESIFQAMRSKLLGNFNLNNLNKIIERKDKNVPIYKKNVDVIYLLITEGFVPNSWFGDFENSGSLLKNRFDKIFLLRIMSRRLYELKS